MMGEYLLSITTLAIFFDLLELLSAERYKALTRAAVSLSLIMAIITPLPSLIGNIRGELDFSVGDAMEGEDIRLVSFEVGISRYIASEFDLSAEEVLVEAINFDPEEMRAEKILITLTGRAALANYKNIEKTVSRLELGVAEVKIEI